MEERIKLTAADGSPPYAAVCRFRRQAGRPDNGNYLESGVVRGNMRVVLSDEWRKTLELIYIESRAKKLEIHIAGADKAIEIYASMDEIEGQLGEDFYRCHRAYIVNMAQITEYDNESITLTNGDKVYLTKKKYSGFVKAYVVFAEWGVSSGKIMKLFRCLKNLYSQRTKERCAPVMKQILYERLIQYILENQDRFYRVAYSYTRHQEDALDVVQSAVCKALEAYESIKNEDAIRTWFYRILINECLTVLKKRKRLLLDNGGLEWEEVYYEKGYELDDDLEKELDRLELDVQGIIKLRFFEELSLKEISCITELNLNTVKTKLYRGLKQLKENIQEADIWAN